MSDSELADLVQHIRGEQPMGVGVTALPEGVNLQESIDQANQLNAGSEPQVGLPQSTDVPPGQAPVAPGAADTPSPGQPVAGIDPALAQQLATELAQARQAIAEQQAREQERAARERFDALQAEEYAFANSIAHLPQWQQDLLLTKRENERAQQVNLALQGNLMQAHEKLQGYESQREHEGQMLAKRSSAMLLMSRAGFSLNDPTSKFVADALTSEEIATPEQMEQRLAGFVNLLNARSQAQAAPPPIIAGGARATNSAAPTPKKGSGDLLGLVSATGYQVVSTE